VRPGRWIELELISRGADQTREIGRRIGTAARPGDVIALSGPLGAGKTCLVQGLARGLEVPRSIAVASPTFGIVHEYPGRVTLYHMDFYRLEPSDVEELGLEEVLEAKGVTVVEWPERWPYLLQAAGLWIRMAGTEMDRMLWLATAESRFLEALDRC
jgi:tRNA threonylcarbamoyladenosine biosynthesis protein TsaE